MSLNGFLKRLLGLFSNASYCRKLVRSERYLAKYKKWVEHQAFTELTAAFYKAYHYKKAGVNCLYRVQLIKEESRVGAIFFYDPKITATDFTYLFDYLKDLTLGLGYKVRTADRRKIAHPQYSQHLEAYYLTPLPTNVPGTATCNQLFGNILLEYTLVNRHPGYIRIMSDSYPDPHFSKPLPFDQFMKAIFQSTEK